MTLTLEGERLALEAGRFATRLHLSAGDLELPLDFGGDPLASLPIAELAALLEPVAYATSSENYRAIFTGVQLEVHPERLRGVAPDAFRLTLVDRPLPEGAAVHRTFSTLKDADAPELLARRARGPLPAHGRGRPRPVGKPLLRGALLGAQGRPDPGPEGAGECRPRRAGRALHRPAPGGGHRSRLARLGSPGKASRPGRYTPSAGSRARATQRGQGCSFIAVAGTTIVSSTSPYRAFSYEKPSGGSNNEPYSHGSGFS